MTIPWMIFGFFLFNWAIPHAATLLYAATLAVVFKDYEYEGVVHGMLCFRLIDMEDDTIEPWHKKLWLDWDGLALAGIIFYRKVGNGREASLRAKRTKKHEAAHGMHQLVLGVVVFFLAYFGHMAWIFASQKVRGAPYTRHPYYDCWSERWARKAAGQKVDLQPNDWSWGPNDLWAWW